MRHRLGAFFALLCSFGASACWATDDTSAQGGGYFGLQRISAEERAQ